MIARVVVAVAMVVAVVVVPVVVMFDQISTQPHTMRAGTARLRPRFSLLLTEHLFALEADSPELLAAAVPVNCVRPPADDHI